MKKLIKIFGIVSGVLALFFILLLLIIKIYSPGYLVPYAMEQVKDKTNGRYKLVVNSDSLQVHFISMSVNLGKTEFKRDTSVETYSDIPFLNQFDVDLSFESFKIQSLNLLRYAYSGRVSVDQIRLNSPSIVIKKNRSYVKPANTEQDEQAAKLNDEVPSEDDSTLADTRAWGEFRSSGGHLLPHIHIDQFIIEQANFQFYDGRNPNPIHEVYGLTFEIDGFELAKKSDIEIEDASLSIDKASSLLSKNTARLSLAGVNLYPDRFQIDSLHYGHIVDKYKINAIRGFRASWLDVGVRNIDISGLHPGQFISDSTILIEKASIDKVRLYLFKDKAEPVINPGHKPLPQAQIRNNATKLDIGTFEILDADLIVDMEAPTAEHPGQITLNQTKVEIMNITNIPDKLGEDPFLKVKANTRIMNKVPVQLNYRLKIDSEEDQYWASCSTDPFDVRILNGFVGSQFFIQFKSGHVDKFTFNFEGNNKANVGEMDFEYSDLRIEKLQGYGMYIEGHPNTGFLASVGNILLPNNRSSSDKNYKKGVIYYEKEFNRDMIHSTIMSLLSGISSSLGFSSKNLQKQRQKAASLNQESTLKAEEVAIQKAEKASQKKEAAEKKGIKEHEKN